MINPETPAKPSKNCKPHVNSAFPFAGISAARAALRVLLQKRVLLL